MSDPPFSEPPSSILIIGAGVFGLSTLHALLTCKRYNSTTIHLVDPYLPPLEPPSSPQNTPPQPLQHQNPHAASIDSSRIIRADYANPAYTLLATEAQKHWRNGFGNRKQRSSQGSTLTPGKGVITSPVYRETGLAVTANSIGSLYVQKAHENCSRVVNQPTTPLTSGTAIREAAGLPLLPSSQRNEIDQGAGVGDLGYINPSSGWADAGAAMAAFMDEVVELARCRNAQLSSSAGKAEGQGKVHFHRATASRLLFSAQTPYPTANSALRPAVLGAMTTSSSSSNEEKVEAEITILAAGAWSGALLDLRGRVEARGQVLAYLALREDEARALAGMKVLLNMSSGMFVLPPVWDSGVGGWVLKVARHGWGYCWPTGVTVPTSPSSSSTASKKEKGLQQQTTISLPAPHFSPIPSEGEAACRTFIAELFPHLAGRAFASTRICWYADTPRGDFLVDWCPWFQGLLVAGGGSGHAFKFAPVLGGRVLGRMEGVVGSEGEGEGGVVGIEESLAELWRWRPEAERERGDMWGTMDGSRGGEGGVLDLREEWEKGGKRRGGSML